MNETTSTVEACAIAAAQPIVADEYAWVLVLIAFVLGNIQCWLVLRDLLRRRPRL